LSSGRSIALKQRVFGVLCRVVGGSGFYGMNFVGDIMYNDGVVFVEDEHGSHASYFFESVDIVYQAYVVGIFDIFVYLRQNKINAAFDFFIRESSGVDGFEFDEDIDQQKKYRANGGKRKKRQGKNIFFHLGVLYKLFAGSKMCENIISKKLRGAMEIKIKKAEGFWLRFAGFMLKRSPDYALLFQNCSSVHTFFMRFNLTLVFLDKNYRIVSVKSNVKPWRIVLPVKNACSILEIPSKISSKTAENLKKNLNFSEFAVKSKK